MRRIALPSLWNFLQFQVGWFALVLSAAAGASWLGIAVLGMLVAVHLGWFSQRNEWVLLLVVGAGGWLWESLIYSLGLIRYAHYPDGMLFAPLWMAGLWVNFATAINHCLSWLREQYVYAALLGAIGGPLAFLAGVKLGAASFPSPLLATLILMAAWAILSPLVFFLARLCTAAETGVVGSTLEGR